MYRKNTTYRQKFYSQKKSNIKQTTITHKKITKEPDKRKRLGKSSSSPEIQTQAPNTGK
jgi:hypothetical protein